MDDDVILNEVATRVVPMIHVFGIYIIVHGHLSPGGGFAGGTVIGIGMVLFVLVFGIRAARRLIPEDTLIALTTLGPLWYAGTGLVGMALGHQFLANANAGLPLGNPGALLSGGLIPVITLGVGASVALTVAVLFLVIVEED
ncbi:MAG: MnhB domain-containing protein [Bacillota bacterium]|nr:MnhB domain-containing protein [Bacillota bacterium]